MPRHFTSEPLLLLRSPFALQFSFAVNGVWTMHFLGTSAVSYGGGFIRYELWQTIGSLVYVFFLTCAAYAIQTCHKRGLFGAEISKSELAHLYVTQPADSAPLLVQLAHLKAQAKLMLSWRLILSGCFLALGILTMHFQGMMAMRMKAMAIWNPVMLGVIPPIAILAGPVAMFTLMTHLGLKRRIVASIVLGTVTLGIHFYGLFSATYVAMPVEDFDPSEWTNQTLIDAEVACVIVILCSSLVRFLLMSVLGVVDAGAIGSGAGSEKERERDRERSNAARSKREATSGSDLQYVGRDVGPGQQQQLQQQGYGHEFATGVDTQSQNYADEMARQQLAQHQQQQHAQGANSKRNAAISPKSGAHARDLTAGSQSAEASQLLHPERD